MEDVLLALVGVIGLMAAGALWFLKFLTRKLFGRESSGERGLVGQFMDRMTTLSRDVRENTAAVRVMQESMLELIEKKESKAS